MISVATGKAKKLVSIGLKDSKKKKGYFLSIKSKTVNLRILRSKDSPRLLNIFTAE